MDFNKYDGINDIDTRRQTILNDIKADTYAGDAHTEGSKTTWSLTDIASQFDNSVGAQLASSHISGRNSRGALKKGTAALAQITVYLKVLTRQACVKDAKGKPLLTNPLSDNFTGFSSKPKKGDIVRISHGQITENENTERTFTQGERKRLQMMNKPTFEFTEHEVDENQCIKLNGFDAMQLLMLKGKRLVVPEFKPTYSRYVDDYDMSVKRQISNWLFEETVEPEVKTK